MIKYAIQKSLVSETKYKDSKDVSETQPVAWYKNFIKEQNNFAPSQDIQLK